jgi:hypothetical protein
VNLSLDHLHGLGEPDLQLLLQGVAAGAELLQLGLQLRRCDGLRLPLRVRLPHPRHTPGTLRLDTHRSSLDQPTMMVVGELDGS